jgi:hypothetical protein
VKVLLPLIAAIALALSIEMRAIANRSTAQLWQAFLCIHRYEGGWDSNTGNGYYGGLQMDYGFMRSYGPEYLRAFGTADNWPPYMQIAVAMRAYVSGRGFYPWPTSARICGLI